MARLLLVLASLFLFGFGSCPAAAPESSPARTAPPPPPPPPPPQPSRGEVTIADDGQGTEPAAAGCQSDQDCPKGQVCEKCGPRGECAPGCHHDQQCPAGQRCNQVQCIRCPCPGICE